MELNLTRDMNRVSLVVAGLLLLTVMQYLFPVWQRLRRSRGNAIDSERVSNAESLYCKKVGGFYVVRETKMPREHLRLVILKLVITVRVL